MMQPGTVENCGNVEFLHNMEVAAMRRVKTDEDFSEAVNDRPGAHP
jgi:hypothetical protein